MSSPEVGAPGLDEHDDDGSSVGAGPSGKKGTAMTANSLFGREASRREQAQQIADEWLNNPMSFASRHRRHFQCNGKAAVKADANSG